MIKAKPQSKGQAMIETLVVLVGAMVPISLGLYYLGKYMEIRDTTIEASRYAAWETTVANPDIESTIAQRFFRNELGGFRGNAGNERQGWGANRLISREFDDKQTMSNPEEQLVYFDDASNSVTERRPTGSNSLAVIDGRTFRLGGLLPSRISMNLDDGGLIESEVSIPLGRTLLLDMDDQYDPANRPAMRVTSTIMSDSWAPVNTSDQRSKTDGLVPFDNNRYGLKWSETVFVIPGATSGTTVAPELGDAAAGGFRMVPIDQSTILPDDRMSPP